MSAKRIAQRIPGQIVHPLVIRLEDALEWDCVHIEKNLYQFECVERNFDSFTNDESVGATQDEVLFHHTLSAGPGDSFEEVQLSVRVLDDCLVKMIMTLPGSRDDECDARVKLYIAEDTPENRRSFIDGHCKEIAKSSKEGVSALLRHAPSQLRKVLMEGMAELDLAHRQTAVKEMGFFARDIALDDTSHSPK